MGAFLEEYLVGRVDSPYWSGSWGYIFPYCPVDEAIQVRIDPVDNSAVAALGIHMVWTGEQY